MSLGGASLGGGSGVPSIWNNPQILGALLPNINLSALQQAMSAELTVDEIPLSDMSQQMATLQSQVTAWQAVQSDLTSLQSDVQSLGGSTLYQGVTASSSNTAVLTASTSSGATGNPATYQVVVQSLMRPEIDDSAAQTSSSTALGYQGSFSINGTSISVSSGDTLATLAQSVNAANAGVTATVLPTTVGGTTKYVLNLASTQGQAITWQDPNGILGGLGVESGGTPTNQVQPAAPASYTINGVQETSLTNTDSTSIPGVTLDLVSANTSQTVTVSVSQNQGAITAAFGQLANDYNTLLGDLSKYGGPGGAVEGDASVLGISSTLQEALTATNASQPAGFQSLAQIGVTLSAPVGSPDQLKMSVNQATLSQALENNPRAVAGLMSSASGGIATLVGQDLGTYVGAAGTIPAQISSLQQQVSTISGEISDPNSPINEEISQQQQILQNDFQNMIQALLASQSQSQQVSQFLQAQSGNTQSQGGSGSGG